MEAPTSRNCRATEHAVPNPTPKARQGDINGHGPAEPDPSELVRDYNGLIAGFRARADFLNVSRLSIDDASGLSRGLSSKLLSMPPMRCLGPISLGAILGTLGLAIVLVEDPIATARFSEKMPKRRRAPVGRGR